MPAAGAEGVGDEQAPSVNARKLRATGDRRRMIGLQSDGRAAKTGEEVERITPSSRLRTMTHRIPRRDALKTIGAAGAGLALGGGILRGQATDIIVAGQPVEIAVSSVSQMTVRVTVRPLKDK